MDKLMSRMSTFRSRVSQSMRSFATDEPKQTTMEIIGSLQDEGWAFAGADSFQDGKVAAEVQNPKNLEQVYLDDVWKSFRFGPVVGEGEQAQVRIVQHTESDEELKKHSLVKVRQNYAAKIVPQYQTVGYTVDPDQQDLEMEIVKQIDHPFVMSPLALIRSKRNYLIVVEQIGKSQNMLSYIRRRKQWTHPPLTEDQVKVIMVQLLAALRYLHHLGIVHKSVRVNKLVIQRQRGKHFFIRLVDFGMAQQMLNENAPLTPDPSKEEITSYTAPEIARNDSYTTKSDVWSAAVCCFILLTSEVPYPGANYEECRKHLLDEEYDLSGRRFKFATVDKWEKLSKEAKEFIQLGLTRDPDLRPTCHELL